MPVRPGQELKMPTSIDQFNETPSRRDFHKLALAALSGMLAGAGGCRSGDEADDTAKYDANLLADEPHVCRGLNTCQGLDKSGKQDDE